VVRVLLGRQDGLVRGALAAVLASERDLTVVAELADGDQLLAAAVRDRPDVAVLDAALPGAATVGELCQALRGRLSACRPLVLLDPGSGIGLGRSLAPLAPWLGLLATDAVPADLVEAVRRLARGERVVDGRLAAAARPAAENPLTARECQVLRLTRGGAPPKEIARALELRVGTVRNYLSRSLAKTGGRTVLEATRVAQDAGWI
jgi:two-component system response regulator DesR